MMNDTTNGNQNVPKKGKSIKKWVILGSVLVAVAGIALASWFIWISPYMKEQEKIKKYNRGAEAIEKGDYEKAEEIFDELGSYDDSETLLDYAKKGKSYESAQKEMKSGNYSKAREILAGLGNFKTSATLLKECGDNIAYEDAEKYIESGDYEKAREVLVGLGSFKDSGKLIEECENNVAYDDAVTKMEAGDYKNARELFTGITSFKDSEKLLKECDSAIAYGEAQDLIKQEKYEEAIDKLHQAGDYLGAKESIELCERQMSYGKVNDLMGEGKYREAIDLLNSPEGKNITDRESLLVECDKALQYTEALQLFMDEKYYSAYEAFNALGTYRDSEDYASRCIRTKPGTRETYHNSAYSGKSVSVTIKTPSDGDYCTYFKLYAVSGGDEVLVLCCFINPGDSLKISFPAGSYVLKEAYGSGPWYGEKEMFGDNGTYRRLLSDGSNDVFTLSSGSYELKLYAVEGGNVGSEKEDGKTF